MFAIIVSFEGNTHLELTVSRSPISPLVGNHAITTEKCNFMRIYIPAVLFAVFCLFVFVFNK